MNFFRRKALTEPRDASLHFTFHCGGKAYVSPRVQCPHQRILFVRGVYLHDTITLTTARLLEACEDGGWMLVPGELDEGDTCLDTLCPACGLELIDRLRCEAVANGASTETIASLRATRQRLEQGLLDIEAFERSARKPPGEES